MELSEITELLNPKLNFNKKKKAINEVITKRYIQFAEQIFIMFLEDLQFEKKWESANLEVIALGKLNYKPALPKIKEICHLNKINDAITISCAEAYVRLCMTQKNDVAPIFELLKFGNYSVCLGALRVLGLDQIIPNEKDMIELIRVCWNIENNSTSKTLMDVRYGLVIACAGWPMKIKEDFLNYCISLNDPLLIKYAENSMKNKHSSL